LQLALENSGPPPLRSGERPFGLEGLTFKQYKQLEIGSFLLFSSLAMITCAALNGCAAMLEHPAFLKKHTVVGAASIWRLPEVHRLLSLPGAALKLVLQGEFGMGAVKPTHLGTWKLPTFDCHAQRIRKPIDRDEMQALAGLNEDGTFKTAIAKEYASPLCDLIANCFVDAGNAVDTTELQVGCDVPFDVGGFCLGDFLCGIRGDEGFGDDFVDTGSLPLFTVAGGGADVLCFE